MVLLLLGLLVVAIILSASAKWPIIEPPLPMSINKTEKLRFIRYLSCSFAMCSGRAKDGDICKSPEVLSVGLIEFEKGKEKTCRELCDELKAVHGVKDKYCGKAYAINFTFDESIEYVGNYSIDPYNPKTYIGKCGAFKSGWQTDLSCYGNIEELTDCACIRCVSEAKPVGRIWDEDPSNPSVTKYPNGIYINVTSMEPDVKCEGEITVFKTPAICRFNEGTRIMIWTFQGLTAYDYCYSLPFIGEKCAISPYMGWCGGLEGYGCPCYAIGISKTS